MTFDYPVAAVGLVAFVEVQVITKVLVWDYAPKALSFEAYELLISATVIVEVLTSLVVAVGTVLTTSPRVRGFLLAWVVGFALLVVACAIWLTQLPLPVP